MGCGVSKRGSHGKGRNNSVEDSYSARRQRVSVRIGAQVKKLHTTPNIIFIFGGPGSRKGCIVDDLIMAYDLKHICTEQILHNELPKKLAGVTKIENVNGVKEVLELDPSHATLDWLLDVITERIDADPEAEYLIDFIPNLKYMLRGKFLQENITEALVKFEEKYPISFALNLTIPTDKVLGAKQVYCASPTTQATADDSAGVKDTGGKGDEADVEQLKRRAAMYEQSSHRVLNYFIQTERLVTVDVTCGIAELIWHQVHRVFCELDFQPQRTVNTILLFVFDDNDLKEFDYESYLMEEVELRRIVDNPAMSLDRLLSVLARYIDNRSDKSDAFVVKTQGTVITKDLLRRTSQKMIAFTDITEGYLETFLPGTPKNFKPAVNSHKYKAVSSVENELCLFPIDTSDEVCLCIALEIAHNRCTD